MSSDRLAPPKGYASWLDYAIATMDTRDLYNMHTLTCEDDELPEESRSPWPASTTRADMRQAATDELDELRLAASPVVARDPFGYMEFSDGLAGCDGLMGYRESGQQGTHCNLCDRDVRTCAVCDACRECHEEWAKKERFCHLGDLLATYQMECHAKIESVLGGMSDDDLRAFVAERVEYLKKCSRPNGADDDLSVQLASWVLRQRYWDKRAEELGGLGAYCIEHDCAKKNCPQGSHDDDD